MTGQTRRKAGQIAALLSSLTAVALLSACASSPQPKGMIHKRTQTKEYFAEKEYGVKASPRVSNLRSRLPRGGGREQVGKPYKIKGKWYYPKEQPGYSKSGKASWYGDAFHGRLTANGEIYDMTHLTAAHPTMPLPSYARVTNLKNGSSVMVRVNDRGPYAHGRIIDLSKRAAEMLDYTHSGIAQVRVDYVGRAPLDGRDDEYLMASYKPGRGAPDPSDGMPTGVMVAMAGPTPTAGIGQGTMRAAAAFPGVMTSSGTASPEPVEAFDMDFPEEGPIIMDRPLARAGAAQVEALGYAERRIDAAADAFAGLSTGGMAPAEIVESWKRQHAATGEYVAVGTFVDKSEAERHFAALSHFGHAEIETSQADGGVRYSINLRPDGRAGLDELLRKSWVEGAGDAFVVRE